MKTAEILHHRRVNFWERHFPGKGAALMDVLHPFYGWKPEFKPAVTDLETRVKAALSPWFLPVSGVRAFPFSRKGDLWREFDDGISLGFGEYVPLTRDSSGVTYPSRRDERIFWEAFDEALGSVFFNAELDGHFMHLLEPISRSCLLVLIDKLEEAAEYKPLLELWLLGNCPIGFDQDYENVLVLTGE